MSSYNKKHVYRKYTVEKEKVLYRQFKLLLMIKLLKRGKKEDLNENISKQLGVQYIQIFKILERMKELDQKIQENQALLKDLGKKYLRMSEKRDRVPLKERTTTAIRLILKKHGKLTSNQLSKIINLSRTRCSEYLKEMEEAKMVRGEVLNRKKYYSIKK